MIKRYKFEYDFWWNCEFEVNTDIYTPEIAQETLDFFSWNYDKEEDQIDEVLKKITIECLSLSAQGYNKFGVIDEFKYLEGFPDIDGSIGLTLLSIDDFYFDKDELSFTVEIL